MVRDSRQQAVRVLVKRLMHGSDDARKGASMVESFVQMDGSPEEVLEEIIGWFPVIRDSFKRKTLPLEFPFPRLVEAFQKLAEKKGIGADQFYSTLLARLVLEGEPEDNLRSLPKQSTKDKILDAALEVFSEKGFHSATVDEIAEQAGLGKGTLYRYFANKETLFNELVRLRLEELERNAWAVFDGQDDVLTMIHKYLHTYFAFFDHNQRLYRLIVQERPDVGDRVQDLYFKKVMRRAPLLMRKIYEASQRGVLKDIDFQTVFYGVMGFVHGVIQKWLARDCSYSLVEELPTVMEVLFYGFVKTSNVTNGIGSGSGG